MERIIRQVSFPGAEMPRLKRVAAYARVSSGKDAMLHSLSAQVSSYSNLIQNHEGWQYCGVYADSLAPRRGVAAFRAFWLTAELGSWIW